MGHDVRQADFNSLAGSVLILVIGNGDASEPGSLPHSVPTGAAVVTKSTFQ